MSNYDAPNNSKRLFSESAIRQRVAAMGIEISKEYRENCLLNPVVAIVLRGGAMFGADLVRQFLPLFRDEVQVEYVWASSYGSGLTSKDEVNIGTLAVGGPADFSWVAGKDILFVDDVLETGRTLDVLTDTARR